MVILRSQMLWIRPMHGSSCPWAGPGQGQKFC